MQIILESKDQLEAVSMQPYSNR